MRERPWDIPLLLDHYRRHHELHGGSVKATRESLGLPKVTFHRYMKRRGITAATAGSED